MCVISNLTSTKKSKSFYITIFTFISNFKSSIKIFISNYIITLLNHKFSITISFKITLTTFIYIYFIPKNISNSQKQQKKFNYYNNYHKILQFYTKNNNNHPNSFK